MENSIGARPGKRRRIDWSLEPCSSYAGDRLTVLPDEPLTRILGMLPTKHAAALTLISNNELMPAFSLLNNFEFDDSPISHCIQSPRLVERTPHFKNFVDYVIRASQSNQLHRFTLRFGRFCRDAKRDCHFVDWECGEQGECHPPLEPARLNSWLSFPLARQVKELDLCINVQCSLGCAKLLKSIFVCETLEMLKLDSNLDLDIGDDVKTFPIRLPRLRLLHLRTLILKDEFVTKLVDSCSVLEDLLLACWWEDTNVFAISSPSLLKLDLTLYKCSGDNNSANVIFQTPNVQSFKYWDNLAQHYSISDMNALVDAEVSIVLELGRDESCSNLCSILKSCSTVSRLSLQGASVVCLDYAQLKNRLPMFHNLNHLELDHHLATIWDKVLVEFLECSPSLQTIVFPGGLTIPGLSNSGEYELERQCWRTRQAIPSCCKSHLKRIVIKDYYGQQRELNLIQFLLKKALVLESLDVSLSNEIEDLDLDPVAIQSALLEMPRASNYCSIRFL